MHEKDGGHWYYELASKHSLLLSLPVQTIGLIHMRIQQIVNVKTLPFSALNGIRNCHHVCR